MMHEQRLFLGGRQIGTGDSIGVGFPTSKVPVAVRNAIPRWLLTAISGAEKPSTIAKKSFGARVWMAGYGRLPEFGLFPLTKKEDTKAPQPTATIMNDPNHKFWSETEQRVKDRNYAVSHAYFWRTQKTSFDPIKAVSKIPVVGDVTKIAADTVMAPVNIVKAVASGERLDHVVVDAIKAQVKLVKDAAPYAKIVVSMVPGVGSGVAAAMGAGIALAEGKSLDQAAKEAIRSALPGGPLAAAAFDTAMKAASGERIDKAILEGTRAALPSDAARAAFDIGMAVATGEKVQNAVAKGLAGMASDKVQEVLAAGTKALGSTPGLSDALKAVPPGVASEGFRMAAGLLSQKGIGEKAVAEVRNRLPAEARQGFDAALKAQEKHFAWTKNITSAPTAPVLKAAVRPTTAAKPAPVAPTAPVLKAAVKPPQAAAKPPVLQAAKKVVTPSASPTAQAAATKAHGYGPYPHGVKATTGVSGLGGFFSDAKWRWFTVYANGRPIAQHGPVWRSEDAARNEAADFIESTMGRGYIGTVARWDWDPSARAWRKAA